MSSSNFTILVNVNDDREVYVSVHDCYSETLNDDSNSIRDDEAAERHAATFDEVLGHHSTTPDALRRLADYLESQ